MSETKKRGLVGGVPLPSRLYSNIPRGMTPPVMANSYGSSRYSDN